MFYECCKLGIKNRNSVLNRVGKSAIFYLKRGQGMRGRAAPPHPRISRVPPPPLPGTVPDNKSQGPTQSVCVTDVLKQ